MTNESGNVVWKAAYTPFGEAEVDQSSSVTNNFRFPGQYYDQESGLHYNYHRYYDPGTGRYLRADPIGLEGGINLYVYALNNPKRFMDPLGLAIWICNRKATGIVGALGGNHSYFCDDRNGLSCGMQGSSGKGNNNAQEDCSPSTLRSGRCRKIPESDELEDNLMECCSLTASRGMWFPPKNDCHEAADDCIKALGLTNPGAPGGRFGDPCDPCKDEQ